MQQAICAPITGQRDCASGNFDTLTRRSLLGSAVIAAACGGLKGSTAAAATQSDFGRAMATFQSAYACEVSYDREVWTAAYELSERDGDRIPDQVDAELMRLTDARCDAEDALIETPAPSLSTCIWKIEYARDRWTEFTDWPETWWRAILSDLRRLAAMEGNA